MKKADYRHRVHHLGQYFFSKGSDAPTINQLYTIMYKTCLYIHRKEAYIELYIIMYNHI